MAHKAAEKEGLKTGNEHAPRDPLSPSELAWMKEKKRKPLRVPGSYALMVESGQTRTELNFL
jgi:hypothetical protein